MVGLSVFSRKQNADMALGTHQFGPVTSHSGRAGDRLPDRPPLEPHVCRHGPVKNLYAVEHVTRICTKMLHFLTLHIMSPFKGRANQALLDAYPLHDSMQAKWVAQRHFGMGVHAPKWMSKNPRNSHLAVVCCDLW